MKRHVRRVLAALTGKQAVTSLLAGIAAVAGSYAAAGYTSSFAFTPVSSFVAQETPGQILTFMRARLPEYAMEINIGVTLGVTVLLFTLAAAIGLELGRIRVGRTPVTGVFVWLLAVVLTGAPFVSLGAAVPAAIVAYVPYRDPPEQDELSLKNSTSRWPDSDRRRLLQTGFGVVGFAGASSLIGDYRTPRETLPELDNEMSSQTSEDLLAEAEQKAFDLPGSPSLVSEIGSFYTIDISTVAPRIDADDWTLSVTGQVENELTITYDELRDMEDVTRFSTLRCVGEDLNSKKMDTGVWTGVPASEIVDRADATGDYTVMHADDDFWNVIPTEAFEQSYIVYGMNGRQLPREHGHPVRVIVPGRWGEVNVKWLTEVEFLDEDKQGYWEERDWEGTGVVSSVTKLWTVEQQENGVLLGGHAYDGTDGVQSVEISTDGGETWEQTELTEELSVGDAWRQWRYELTGEPGDYDVVVRMRDGNGDLQEQEASDAFPDGATGWVSQTVTIEN